MSEFKDVFESAVRKIALRLIRQNTVCEVVSVDKVNNICVVNENGNEIVDVRLLSTIDDFTTKFVIYPKVGSLVAISYLWISNKCYVSKYSETDGIQLNGNTYSLVKAEELETQLDKNNAILNAVLTVINGTPIPEPGSGAASALQAALKTALTLKFVGDFSSIKNENVKHG